MKFFSSLIEFLKKLFGGSSSPATTTTTTTETTDSTVTDTTTTRGRKKLALCMGINDWPGSSNDLRGCVNDARAWKKMLSETYGFSVRLLLDSNVNKRNVKSEFLGMIREALPGDHLAVTYSGHGSSVPDYSGDEPDGRDETWYVYDGHITDDEFRAIISELKDGVTLTIISDSCHSGTVTRSFISTMSDEEFYSVPRYMPPEDDMDSILVNSLPVKKAIFLPEENMKEVLLTGCQSHEYSYDAYFNGKHMGAFSHNALLILRDNPKITYKDFYKKLRTKLPSSRYPQTPSLEGNIQMKASIMFE